MSEALEQFQTRLSQGKAAQITAATSTEVLGTISYLEDLTGADLARQGGVGRSTGARYVKGTITPPLSRFVRIMDRLGFDVFIIKKPNATSS